MNKLWAPALLLGALAFLLPATAARGWDGSRPARRQAKPAAPKQSQPPDAQQQTRQTKPPASPTPVATPKPEPTPAAAAEVEDDEVIRVTSNLVVVPVSVTDARGEPVQGLKASDFRLEEEGRAQEIAQIGDPEQVPLEIAILLDVSGSVDARINFEKEAASRFLKQVLKPADRATVFAIDREPRLEQPRATAEVAAAKLLAIAPAKGPTAFYDAVVDAAGHLARNSPPQHRRVIVVISDGEDNFSERTKRAIGATAQSQRSASVQLLRELHAKMQQEVQRELQSAEAAFYSINPSGEALRLNVISKRAQDGMEKIATATGGTSFVPDKLEDLDAIFRQIASELRSQYLLQYYSSTEAPTGKYLGIRVRTPARPELRVRARQGYYKK